MRNSLRLSIGAAALSVLAACSSQSAQPAMSDDLKQDLAKVGGSDVQLAGAGAPKLDVVSNLERANGNVVSRNGPDVSKAPSARRGHSAVVKSKRKEAPVIVESKTSDVVAPVLTTQTEIAPEPVPSQQRPQQAPMPSTQREPRGGWKTPGQVIRNAPFPINP